MEPCHITLEPVDYYPSVNVSEKDPELNIQIKTFVRHTVSTFLAFWYTMVLRQATQKQTIFN